ncbi:amidohydrolase family protein [Accumulibacter sp.]|jgi:predicted TIM-barrel fold metal-dependent hydrolase|uniref:amidohydrolase family protein n=1 Tax=Accumulibacter sp. TaxID=2053492 RepID=UPI0025BA9445|nr:amidohydrolase family protein [Accumulibacter sp.]
MPARHLLSLLTICSLGLGMAHAAGSGEADPPLPLFDAHLHYNWEPAAHFPLARLHALFRAQRIMGILATSHPNDGTRALQEAKSKDLWVVPFIRPYRTRSDVQTWMNDPQTTELIVGEFKHGYYQGIGEFHLAGQAAHGPQVRKTVDFAVRQGLYLHAHADDEALEILFGQNPGAKIIWAHTGFSTEPARVENFLRKYPNLWCELSYRHGITDGNGKLTRDWQTLFERYPERFLVGSDTWIDERWNNYGDIMATYRTWLAQLPPDVAEQIAFRNAERLFRRK